MACGRRVFAAGVALALGGCLAPNLTFLEEAARDHGEQARSAFAVADYESAVALYSRSLRHHQATGNRLETCFDLLNLAVVYRAMGRARAAEECMTAFTAVARDLDGMLLPNDERHRLNALRAEADWFQAVLALDGGQRERAQQFLEKARAWKLPQLRARIRLLEQRLGSPPASAKKS
jgi:hypothetical protein